MFQFYSEELSSLILILINQKILLFAESSSFSVGVLMQKKVNLFFVENF